MLLGKNSVAVILIPWHTGMVPFSSCKELEIWFLKETLFIGPGVRAGQTLESIHKPTRDVCEVICPCHSTFLGVSLWGTLGTEATTVPSGERAHTWMVLQEGIDKSAALFLVL